MHGPWVSWAMSRLGLDAAALADQVGPEARLPGTAAAREVVELHLAALDLSLDLGSPDLLVPQLRWELARWPTVADGVPSVAPAVLDVLQERLDELTVAGVVRHVGAALARAATLEDRAWAERGCGGLSGLGVAAQTHLELAMAGHHDAVVAHATGLVDLGTTPDRVLLDVLVPAQQELGRLWARGVLSPDQEAVATAGTRCALAALSLPSPRAAARRRGTLVAATAPGDRHDLGLRIVTGLLQQQGWCTRYAGPSAGAAEVAEAVVASGARLVLLGASMTAHVPGLRRAVASLRADPRCAGVTVMVGGEPFRHAPALGEWVGADLVAEDGPQAVRAAALLVPAARTGLLGGPSSRPIS